MKNSNKILVVIIITLLVWALTYPQEFTGFKPDLGDVVMSILIVGYFITRAIEESKGDS